jgi:hypothetical protein
MTIAQSHLDPQVLNAVCSILASDVDSTVRDGDAPCYLSTVASWANKIRFHTRLALLHYVGASGDHPPDNCLFPGTDGWGGNPLGNVVDTIRNVTSILADCVSASCPLPPFWAARVRARAAPRTRAASRSPTRSRSPTSFHPRRRHHHHPQ